jgi:hypothetical protein
MTSKIKYLNSVLSLGMSISAMIFSIQKVDGIVKSRFKDWIPAFAGMTPMVSI